MVFRVDANIIDSATGGSEQGPPVMTARVSCSVDSLLAIAMIAHPLGGVITWELADSNEAWPMFWPSATQLPTIPLESKSDSHLRSMREEAIRCWEAALGDMTKRREWLGLLGAHECVRDQLLLPFRGVEAVVTVPNFVNTFLSQLMECVTHPDVRIFGYRLTRQWLAGKSTRRVVHRHEPYEPRDVQGRHLAELEAPAHDSAWVMVARAPSPMPTDEELGQDIMRAPAWAL